MLFNCFKMLLGIKYTHTFRRAHADSSDNTLDVHKDIVENSEYGQEKLQSQSVDKPMAQ